MICLSLGPMWLKSSFITTCTRLLLSRTQGIENHALRRT
jgi:hypothetical protein